MSDNEHPIVTLVFTAPFASYNVGEVAAFLDDDAAKLLDRGVAEPPPPVSLDLTPAVLTGGVSADTAALLAALKLADGSFAIVVDGTTQEVGPIDMTAATSLGSIAAAIGNNMTGATCEIVSDHFAITTTAKGAAATLDYARPPAAGTDISSICLLTAASGAALTQGSGP